MKDTRLKDIIGDDEAYENLIGMYRLLHGKENLEKRLLLKTMVYASLHHSFFEWEKARNFFHADKGRFTMAKFKYLVEAFYYQTPHFYLFDADLKKIFGYLV